MCPAAVDTAVCSTWKAQSDNYAHYDFDDAAELPYQFIAHLGNGRTAVIDKIKSNRTNRVYARKIWHLLPHNSRRREREKDAYRREIEIARRLSQHPHIVRVIESYTTRDTFALILEPAADGGDLKTYLALFSSVEDRNQKAAMEKTIFEAYGCLASGLAFMHSCRIRHRDIKPENILIHAGTVLYADFGVSRDYSGRAHSATEGHPGAFTMRYCAPEVKEQENRTWKSDVFSLGCVYLVMYAALSSDPALLEIAKGRFFEQLEDIQRALRMCRREPELIHCMYMMLRYEEGKRLDAVGVIQALWRRRETYFCGRCQDQTVECSSSSIIPISNLSETTPDEEDEYAQLRNTTLSKVLKRLYPDLFPEQHDSISGIATNAKTVPGSDAEVLKPQATVHRKADSTASIIQPLPVNPHRSSRLDYATQDITTIAPLPYKAHIPTNSSEMRVIPRASSLSRLGVRHWKTVYMLHKASISTEKGSIDAWLRQGQIVYEDCVYDWVLQPFGLGIRFTKRKPYGSIFPSINTYPVVSKLSSLAQVVTMLGSIDHAQALFSTGALHPFMQVEGYETLLGYFVSWGRLDLCELLLAYGVRPNNQCHTALNILCQYSDCARSIDLLRFVLNFTADLQTDDEFDEHFLEGKFTFNWPQNAVHWLFNNGAAYGLDRSAVEELCLRLTLRNIPYLIRDGKSNARKHLLRYLTPSLQRRIRTNDISLLVDVFFPYYQETEDEFFDPKIRDQLGSMEDWETRSFVTGTCWLQTLEYVQIDIADYLRHEFQIRPHLLLDEWMETTIRRRLVLEVEDDTDGERVEHQNGEENPQEKAKYRFGWTTLDKWWNAQPLVSEFLDLVSIEEEGDWPYSEKKMGRIPGSWVD